MMSTACECRPESFPFFCARHQCRKTEGWYGLCRRRADYFALWEEGMGPGQSIPESSRPAAVPVKDYVARIIATCKRPSERAEQNPLGLHRPIKRRTIEAVQTILETHCLPCEWFQRGTCYRLPGCAKSTEHVSLLVSTAGRCPDGRF